MAPLLFQETTYNDLAFQGYCVSLKQAFAVIPFFKSIELIRSSSCSHPLDEWSFFCHCRIEIVVASLVSGMYILKEACYMTTLVPAIHFFYDSVIISREYLKQSIQQGHCVYFTLVAAIHCKWYLADSRKFEVVAAYSRKAIVALSF